MPTNPRLVSGSEIAMILIDTDLLRPKIALLQMFNDLDGRDEM